MRSRHPQCTAAVTLGGRSLRGWRPNLPAAALLAGLLACTPDAVIDEPEPFQGVTTGPTVAWLIDRISTNSVRWQLIEPDATGQLTDAQLEAMADAQIVVRAGAGLDAWADVLDLPKARTVDLSQGIQLLERPGSRHTHGDQPEHSHSEPLPGTWHDPALLARSLDTLAAELDARAPDAVEPQLLASLRVSLDEASDRLEAIAAQLGGTELTATDEFAYLRQALWNAAPQADALAVRRLHLYAHQSETALQPAREGRQLETTLARLLPLLPPPADGNYLALIRGNLESIATATQKWAPASTP